MGTASCRLFPEYYPPLPHHFRCQLYWAHHRSTALQNTGCQSQWITACTHHRRGRVAQQPPSVPCLCATGVLLVGNRCNPLCHPRAGLDRCRLECADTTTRSSKRRATIIRFHPLSPARHYGQSTWLSPVVASSTHLPAAWHALQHNQQLCPLLDTSLVQSTIIAAP